MQNNSKVTAFYYAPKIGDVWRKHGPCNWVKIVRRMWTGFPEYDEGLRGASVRFTNLNGNWCKQTWFIPSPNPKTFAKHMRETWRE